MLSSSESRDRITSTRAAVMVLVSAASYGSISILTVFVMREGVPLLSAMTWRFFLAAAVLVLLARAEITAYWRNALPLMAVGGFMQAAVTYLSLSALRYIPATVLGFLFFTYPAWLAVIGAVRGTDPPTPRRIATLILAMLGVAIMIGIPGGSTGPAGGVATESLNPIGIALALGSSLLYAIYLPAIAHLQRDVPAGAAAAYVTSAVAVLYVFAALGILLVGTAMRGSVAMPLYLPANERAWGYILILALFSTVLAFRMLFKGLAVLGARRTSIIGTAEPFFTTILAVALLGESLRWPTLLGGAFIAAAVILVAKEGSPPRERESKL